MSQKVSKVFATRSFENSVKSLKKAHKQKTLSELYDTVKKLVNLEITKQKSNHPLKDAEGHKDIHLEGGKLILIYRYEDDILMLGLRLQDVVNHDQLQSYPKKKYKAPAKEYDIENIKSSTNIEYDDFISWYEKLPEELQWRVDDIADAEALPFYEDCTAQELTQLRSLFEMDI